MELNFELKAVDGEELTILELQDAMNRGDVTSRELVMYYMYRIAAYDQGGRQLNSIMEVNPDAIFIAEALDQERKVKGMRSRLHGIPVLLKDNIATNDKLRTSAGALALEHHISESDAFLVEQLRNAGAIILGKANMTEWANAVSSTMWAGYSSKGGQVLNPYGDFFVGGSSSGSAVAVASNFTSCAVGTETSASILSPAVQNSIVGIKPTVGLISRTGVIPFSYAQDTAGPMARTVADASILLSALVGKDENDPATWRHEHSETDYTAYLDEHGLAGANIGIFRDASIEQFRDADEYDETLFNNAVNELIGAGARVVENIEIPAFHRKWEWNKLDHEFKHGIERFLQSLPAHAPVHSLSELIHWNENNAETSLKYGQDLLKYREQLGNRLNSRSYLLESLSDLYYAQQEGIDFAIKKYDLDAILFPAYVGAEICARAGYPSVAVPAGYKDNGRPFGITFAGKAFSEPTLIRIAFAFEQRTKHRKTPVLS